MPVYVDSTALIALGELDSLDLLQYLSTTIVITPTIQFEVRRHAATQVVAAIRSGWLAVETPDAEALANLMESTRLDEGEASLIQVAEQLSGDEAELIVDEGYAFNYLQQTGMTKVICLAQALHRLEETNHLPSCKAIMDELVARGFYGWAKPVKASYLSWCSTTGKVPVL